MHFITKVGAASALVSLVSAIPAEYSPVEKRGVAFTVHQTVAKTHILSGPAQNAKVYGKFGKEAPADVKAAAANNDGTVTATPEQYDSEYLCPVSIGGQTLNLDFDTGSSDLYAIFKRFPILFAIFGKTDSHQMGVFFRTSGKRTERSLDLQSLKVFHLKGRQRRDMEHFLWRR